MVKRINLTVNDELYDLIEKYRIENNFSDKQDALRNIVGEKLSNSSFLDKLKNLFN